MITCFIRYRIDPTKKAEFAQCARSWGQAISRCGADLIGHFAPHEGSSTLACGVYSVESLPAYEATRARLQDDPLGRANHEFAQAEKFLLVEDCTFLKLARGLHIPQTCAGPARGVDQAGGTRMIAIIFEVWPKDGKADRYFEIAAGLKADLAEIDGFISVERFESLMQPGKYLSLSFWRDEAAVTDWRARMKHREAQAQGRGDVFADYRLRVAEVARDYGMTDRDQAPDDSRAVHGG
jgi:heme-degrading monooxygenase HmoA